MRAASMVFAIAAVLAIGGCHLVGDPDPMTEPMEEPEEGRIDFSRYAEMEPVYTEYNIGHYSRKFSLSSKIDQQKISAEMADGVLTLTLPKAEEAKPRRIKIG